LLKEINFLLQLTCNQQSQDHGLQRPASAPGAKQGGANEAHALHFLGHGAGESEDGRQNESEGLQNVGVDSEVAQHRVVKSEGEQRAKKQASEELFPPAPQLHGSLFQQCSLNKANNNNIYAGNNNATDKKYLSLFLPTMCNYVRKKMTTSNKDNLNYIDC